MVITLGGNAMTRPHSHPDWGDGLELSARHDGDMNKSLISDRLCHPRCMSRLDGSVI